MRLMVHGAWDPPGSLRYGGLSVTSEFNFFKTFHHTVLPMSPTPYEVGGDTYTALHDGKQL